MWQLYGQHVSFIYKFIILLFVFNIHSKLIVSLVGSCPSLINLM